MNRVIPLESLPGTGKTTNSYRIFEQLVRNGRDVRWVHEVSQPHPTLLIEITAQAWDVYDAEMLRFLGIVYQDAPSCKAKDGTYVNNATGASFSVKDGVLTDPEGAKRRLSPKSPTEFFMEGLSEILCFEENGSAKLRGQQIIPQWSETGTIYAKKETERGMNMNAKMSGLFSGFPAHHFPDEIAQALRESLPFISAWPEDYRWIIELKT